MIVVNADGTVGRMLDLGGEELAVKVGDVAKC